LRDLAVGECSAAPPPEAVPEQAGMSTQRPDRLTATFKKAIDAGDMPGRDHVARNGKLVFQQAIGCRIPRGHPYG
jgi:hypothetical protein